MSCLGGDGGRTPPLGPRNEGNPPPRPKRERGRYAKARLNTFGLQKCEIKGKGRTINPRAREPDEVCGGEMKSSLSVVKVGILRLRLSRGLDARGCWLLRRCSVMPWWRRGSYATIDPFPKIILHHEIWLKTKIKTKLNLIYDSKYKSNGKWWKIKMKTCNLTQIRARNDPINRRMHGYSFHNFEDKNWHSRYDLSLLPRSIFDFMHSSDTKTCQEGKEIKWLSNCGV